MPAIKKCAHCNDYGTEKCKDCDVCQPCGGEGWSGNGGGFKVGSAVVCGYCNGSGYRQ